MKVDIQNIAKKIAISNKFPNAERYDLSLRDYDGMIEVLGYVSDPNINSSEIPIKRWLTIGVLPQSYTV